MEFDILYQLMEHKDKKANTGRPTDRARAMKHKIEEVEGEEGEKMGGESDGVVGMMWVEEEKDINPRKTAKVNQDPVTPATLPPAFNSIQGYDDTATIAAISGACLTGDYVRSGRVRKRCRQEDELSDLISYSGSDFSDLHNFKRRK